MTELKWKKFTEKGPDSPWPWFWITDGQHVWLRHIAYLEDSDRELSYAEAHIEYPPVPKKEMHSCTKKWERYTTICQENEKGELEVWDEEYSNESYFVASFCPFCGYSKEKG